jgi:hypothetical protein
MVLQALTFVTTCFETRSRIRFPTRISYDVRHPITPERACEPIELQWRAVSNLTFPPADPPPDKDDVGEGILLPTWQKNGRIGGMDKCETYTTQNHREKA